MDKQYIAIKLSKYKIEDKINKRCNDVDEAIALLKTDIAEVKIRNMKTEEIKDLFAKFEAASALIEGVECWSARELQWLLG